MLGGVVVYVVAWAEAHVIRVLLLAHCVDLDVNLYYVAFKNLVYGYGNVPQTTAESSDTTQIHFAQHLQKSVDLSIQLPADLQCNPVQMAEVVQREHVLVAGSWLYPILNVANTVHHGYYLAEWKQREQKQAS